MMRVLLTVILVFFTSLASLANDEEDKAIAQRLKQALLSHHVQEMAQAIEAIKARSDRFTIAMILEGLANQDGPSRTRWALAAAEHDGDQFVKGLLELYSHHPENADIRAAVVMATFNTKSRDLKALQKNAYERDPDTYVRTQAMTCLYHEDTFQNREYLETLLKRTDLLKEIKFTALKLLIEADHGRFEEFTDASKTPDPEIRVWAYRLLLGRLQTGRHGVPFKIIARGAEDSSPLVRRTALNMMLHFGAINQFIPLYIRMSSRDTEKDGEIRALAVNMLIEALGVIQRPEILLESIKKALEKSVDDPDQYVTLTFSKALLGQQEIDPREIVAGLGGDPELFRKGVAPPVALFEIVFNSKNRALREVAARAIETYPSIIRDKPEFIQFIGDVEELKRIAELLKPNRPHLAMCDGRLRNRKTRESNLVH